MAISDHGCRWYLFADWFANDYGLLYALGFWKFAKEPVARPEAAAVDQAGLLPPCEGCRIGRTLKAAYRRIVISETAIQSYVLFIG